MREIEALALLRRHAVGGAIVFLVLAACIALADLYAGAPAVASHLQRPAACAEACVAPRTSAARGAVLRVEDLSMDRARPALRRLWVEDAAIRNFVEVAENQWDFAASRDIAGFGPLPVDLDVARMLATIVTRPAARRSADLVQQSPPSSLRLTGVLIAEPPSKHIGEGRIASIAP